jgi:hypothetical protein
MIWEALAAVFLLLATLPLWFFASLGWGFLVATYTLVVLGIEIANRSTVDFAEFAALPLLAAMSGFGAAWSIPETMWAWAKFEHPWWALVIALLASAAFGGSSRR